METTLTPTQLQQQEEIRKQYDDLTQHLLGKYPVAITCVYNIRFDPTEPCWLSNLYQDILDEHEQAKKGPISHK